MHGQFRTQSAMIRYLENKGIKIQWNTDVKEILPIEQKILIKTDKNEFTCK